MSRDKFEVADVDDLGDNDHVIVEIKGREIAVFNKGGEYFAILNHCPHQGGPLCEGHVAGTNSATFDRETLTVTTNWGRDGQIVSCPWHAWEFDITSGKCLSDSDVRVPTYETEVKDGKVLVSIV